MVWALILAFLLVLPSPALAEPVGVDSDAEEISQTDSDIDSPAVDGGATDDGAALLADSDSPDASEVLDVAEPVALAAISSSVYGSVSPTSGYISFFADFLPKIPWGADYVLFRSGQYTYSLCYGDIAYSSGTFSGSDLHSVVLTLNNGYNSDYSISFDSGSLSLNPSSYIVFSNLGDYPTLSPSWTAEYALIFALCVLMLCSLLRSIWSWLIRSGSNVFLS